MRIYDPRLGRFLSVDPFTKSFPSESPYIYAGNNPIGLIDVEGGKKTYYITLIKDGTSTTIKIVTKYEVKSVAERHRESVGVRGQTLFTSPEVSNTYTYDLKQNITIDANSGKISYGKIEQDGLRSNSAVIRGLQDNLEEVNSYLSTNHEKDNEAFSGGIPFVSSNGGGEEKRKGANADKQSVDITSLLTLFGNASSASNNEKVEKLINKFKQALDAIQIVDETVDNTDKIIRIQRPVRVGKEVIKVDIDTPVRKSDVSKYKRDN